MEGKISTVLLGLSDTNSNQCSQTHRNTGHCTQCII